MKPTNANRTNSRSKDFESFMRNASIGNESRDYLVAVGKLENWRMKCAGIIARDYESKTADDIIGKLDAKVVELEQQLMTLFSNKVLDNAMSFETKSL